MIAILPLTQLDPDDGTGIMTGYTSHARYRASTAESAEPLTLALELEPLSKPYIKGRDPPDDGTLARCVRCDAFDVGRGCGPGRAEEPSTKSLARNE